MPRWGNEVQAAVDLERGGEEGLLLPLLCNCPVKRVVLEVAGQRHVTWNDLHILGLNREAAKN